MTRLLRPLIVVQLTGLISIAAAQPANSCVACHGDPEIFPEDRLAVVHSFEEDAHQAVGLSCQDCHGGNPDPALSDDMAAAMDPNFRPNPYVGVPRRTENPQFCGRCHSDPSYMRRFKPDARVDQEVEYWTSHHGQALRQGDQKVAVCSDCHQSHGVLSAGNVRSPVYPARVAETCSKCHADPGYMDGYRLADGRPLPVDQRALWEISVHGRAMIEREDVSAPTCNDCHGNHGATPPGLESITFVCGQCHGREAGLFRGSPKHAGFQTHNEFLRGMESPDCSLCHEVPQILSEFPPIASFTECTICHGNHGIVRPTVAMLSPLPATPCAFCHEDARLLAEVTVSEYEEMRDQLVSEGEGQGRSGALLFDWLVDQTLMLPTHTGPRIGEGVSPLRPEFERLFTKFRIGKTHFSYRDPATGEETDRPVVRCSKCHIESDEFQPAPGASVAEEFVSRVRGLTAHTAQAERVLLRARRGGVQTRAALEAVDQAVDAQIELQVLIHTFGGEEDGAFHRKYLEGMQFAEDALAAGHAALAELSIRRRGLYVSLAFVLLVLVALGLKIRQMEE
jgi:predicted CXXCH cytochrome family protein